MFELIQYFHNSAKEHMNSKLSVTEAKWVDPEPTSFCLSSPTGSESVRVSVDVSMQQKEFSVP